jgi:hypothetical protein
MESKEDPEFLVIWLTILLMPSRSSTTWKAPALCALEKPGSQGYGAILLIGQHTLSAEARRGSAEANRGTHCSSSIRTPL